MRYSVQGDCGAARVLRGYLEKSGYFVSDAFPDYTVFLDEVDGLDNVTIDSVDCDLERRVLRFIEELGVNVFTIQRAVGITSDREIHIAYPTHQQKAVELGAFRALTYSHERGWRNKLKKLVGIAGLFLLSASLHAEELPAGFSRVHPILFQPVYYPIVRFWDGTRIVNGGDFTNNAIRVNVVAGGAGGGAVTQSTGAGAATNYWNVRLTDGAAFLPLPTALGGAGGLKIECLSGCGGAAAFADATAFTFGTTSIGNIGAVVDDVGTNTVAENSAGTPRMNTNRILYFNPRTNAGVEIPFPAALGAGGGLKVDGSGTALPVSGTVAVSSSFLLDATYTGRTPAGASPADNESNTNTALSRVGAFNFIFDGATWDRWTGAVAQGTTPWTDKIVDSAGADQTSVKGTQTSRFLGNQSVIDAGRNQTNYFMALPILTTNAEVMMTMTGYKGGVAVAGTATPAVVTSGKTYRINSIQITYVPVAAAGTCRVTLRANLTGVGVIGSPLVWEGSYGGGNAAAVVSNFSIPFPDGMEFAAGTGVAVGIQGFSAVQVATAVGYCAVSLLGFEY